MGTVYIYGWTFRGVVQKDVRTDVWKKVQKEMWKAVQKKVQIFFTKWPGEGSWRKAWKLVWKVYYTLIIPIII